MSKAEGEVHQMTDEPTGARDPERIRLMDLVRSLTVGQAISVAGCAATVLIAAFGAGKASKLFEPEKEICKRMDSWPKGDWNVSGVMFYGHPETAGATNWSRTIKLQEPTSGTWLSELDNRAVIWKEEKITLSRPIKAGESVALTYISLEISYISKNELQVSPDGCSMVGHFISTLGGKPYFAGEVSFCWAFGPDCKATFLSRP